VKKLFLPVGLLVLATGLGACGPGGESDEDKVRDVVEKVASNDPEVCKDLTARFLSEEFDGDEGKCEKQAREAEDEQNLEIEKVEVDGDRATVEAKADDDKGTARLVKEGGDWKLDELEREGRAGASRGKSPDETAAQGAVDAFLIAVRGEDANVFCGLLTERFARSLFDTNRLGVAECAERLAKSFNWSRLQRRFRGAKVRNVGVAGNTARAILDNRINFGLRKLKGRWQINRVTYP
jgi:hypothetical protein